MKKYFVLVISIATIAMSIALVGCAPADEHAYSTAYTSDDTYHWHACTDSNCDSVIDKAEHVYSDEEDLSCNVCNYIKNPANASLGLAFEYNGNGYSVTGIGTCTDTAIVIPNSYDGVPVTAINNSAFSSCTSITAVTLPESTTTIGGTAFHGCVSLVSVTMPNSLTTIEDGAFAYCESLASIIVPNQVVSIGDSTFSECTSLSSITIGEKVETIGEQAFYACSSLESIAIPDSVTSVGTYAFWNCTALSSATIGDGEKVINSYAFYGCSSLKSVTIGNGIKAIDDATFMGCDSLATINIPDSVTSIGNSAFSNCKSLITITIPSSVTSIGNNAFWNCNKLIEVVNLSSLNIVAGEVGYGYVGKYARHVTDDATVLNITNADGYVFYKHNTIYYLMGYVGDDTALTLPNYIKGESYNIYQYAFYACSALTSVTIPDTVSIIGDYAFSGCTSLTSITIPSGISDINCGAFTGCTALTSVTFDNTDGWEYGPILGVFLGDSISVIDASVNATNLVSTLSNYYWKRTA